MNSKPFFNAAIFNKQFHLTVHQVEKYNLTPIEAHFHATEKLLEVCTFGNCGLFL